MKKSLVSKTFALIMSLMLIGAIALTGCGPESTGNGEKIASAGTLLLKVNPEIAVAYDENGIVTALTAKNDDAKAILKDNEELVGKETREVVAKLVEAIGEAGYFVEEIEGEARQITIEIEKGSKLPHDKFIEEVVSEVRKSVEKNNWKAPLGIKNDSDYGLTDYNDTDYHSSDYDDSDYGPNNDGVTDYDDSDYDDTDYGPNNDGVTDYDDSDYGPNSDGVTDLNNKSDYDDSDYGHNSDGATDLNNKSDYNDSDYDN